MGLEIASSWARWRSSKAFWAKACLWGLALGACVRSGAALAGGDLPDPQLYLQTQSGWLAVAWLIGSLWITPLARLGSKTQWIGSCRRLAGLWAFAFAAVHLSSYAGLDQGFDLASMARDAGRRPFVLMGWLAFLAMLPLAATSTKWAMRGLGRRWKALHRLAYAALAFAMVHWYWMREPKRRLASWETALAVAALCAALRAWEAWRARRRSASGR